MTICLENMNSRYPDDVLGRPDQICDHVGWGFDVCKRVNSPSVKMLYDIYHAQIMDGNICDTIKDNLQWIGHFHTAGVPGRHEPDDTQELDYRFVANAIVGLGFTDYIAHECRPTPGKDPIEVLRRTQDLGACSDYSDTLIARARDDGPRPQARYNPRMGPPLPEVWLRGPIAGFPPELMPVAHSLLQVLEEIDTAIRPLSFEELWARPGGAASVAFHAKHLAGSLDRLLTYARGERLGDAQRSALDGEDSASANDQPATLLRAASEAIERALQQVRTTPVETLDEPRSVGRAGLPSTVRGLLFHAAEHAQRHAGQIVTTAKIVCGSHARP